MNESWKTTLSAYTKEENEYRKQFLSNVCRSTWKNSSDKQKETRTKKQSDTRKKKIESGEIDKTILLHNLLSWQLDKEKKRSAVEKGIKTIQNKPNIICEKCGKKYKKDGFYKKHLVHCK